MPRPNYDTVIVGAGVMGLWAARHAVRAGRKVLVVEKRRVGAGASGGVMGSLMPHAPDRWNTKKEMQFQALCVLDDEVAALEEDTGHDCGFRRCGRLVPLRHEGLVKVSEQRKQGAERFWQVAGRNKRFTFEILPPGFAGTIAEDWLAEEISPFGATYDTLSARLNPRALVMALASYIRENATLTEEMEATQIDGDGKQILLSDGSWLSCGEVIIANGFEAYRFLEKAGATHLDRPVTGRGVKGQAILLRHEHNDDKPMIFDGGAYVIPHKGRCEGNAPGHDRIALGATTDNDWLGEGDMEEQVTRVEPGHREYMDYAVNLCPRLKDAEVMQEWANVRPRNTMVDPETGRVVTDPVFGALDDYPNIRLAIGGFKISFGVAHYGSRDWFV